MASDRDTAAAGGPERVLERMSDRYLELDTSCRVVDSNAAGRELLIAAAGPSDVRGRDLRDLLTGPDARRVTEALHRTVETGTASTVEATLVRPDGRFEFRVFPENSGVSLYVTPIPSETTGPGVMQRQTTVINDLYEAFNDPAADLDGKVASLLAIGRAALDTEYGTLSRVDDDRYTFEYVDAADDAVEAGDEVDLSWTICERAVATKKRVVLSDVQAQAPDPAARDDNRGIGISCYIGAPVTVDDETYGTLCFYDRDTRDGPFSEWEAGLVDFMGLLVSYELQRERTETRLRERNEALEGFRKVLSHDLRNPVTVAQGYLDIAMESADIDALEHVDAALDRIQAIIEDVSDIAAIQDGSLDLDPLETAAVAGAAWEMVAEADGTLEVPATGAVLADESRLQRLLENLLANAVAHTDGPVTIRVGDLPDGFYVADTGDGVAPADRERVFTSGFTTGDGTGLGLSIVTEIAEAHGWTYELTESDSGGARFEFTGVTRP